MAELSLQHISKEFDGSRVVSGVSVDIASGEFFSILGPSGCGKTTLLRMIAGFEAPSSGKILLDGQDITGLPARHRAIGMVFQNYALFPHMTVFDNVAFGLEVARVPRDKMRDRVRRMLDSVHLGDKANVFVPRLSGGEQQRVAVARALVVEPKVLLLDEPLSNLDIALRLGTREEIRSLQRRTGITTIYVTHDQSEAMSLSDRIAVMNKGVVEQIDSPAELYSRPANAFVAGFVGGSSLLRVRVAENGRSLTVHDWNLTIPLSGVAWSDGEQMCAVKPEAVKLGPNAKHGEAVIESKEYLGFTTAFVLKIGEARLKSVCVTTEDIHQLAVSMSTGFKIDWSRCSLFPTGQAE